MNCKKARELMVLDLYSEAGAPDKARLEEHLRGCASCAAEKAETRRLFTLLDEHKPEEAPAADWEKAWRGIQSGIREKSPASPPLPRRASLFRPALAPGVRRGGPDPRPRRRDLHRKVRLRALAPDGRRAARRRPRASAASIGGERRPADPARPERDPAGLRLPSRRSQADPLGLRPLRPRRKDRGPGRRGRGRPPDAHASERPPEAQARRKRPRGRRSPGRPRSHPEGDRQARSQRYPVARRDQGPDRKAGRSLQNGNP